MTGQPDRRVETVARALHDDGAWCGGCGYDGWDSCSECRRACTAHARVALAAADAATIPRTTARSDLAGLAAREAGITNRITSGIANEDVTG